MGRRVRERDKEKTLPPSKRKAKGELVDGQVTTDWNKTLTQFTAAYPNRINLTSIWTAGCFSDSACFVLQAAFFRSRKSLSTSFGVRYPRAE